MISPQADEFALVDAIMFFQILSFGPFLALQTAYILVAEDVLRVIKCHELKLLKYIFFGVT